MRGLWLSLWGMVFVASCAKAQNIDFEETMGDGGATSKDGSVSKDGSTQPDAGGCTKCGGMSCVDFMTDMNNCGNCGNACSNGACCGGKCIDTTSDNANCGACGSACSGNDQCCNGSCTNTKTDTSNCGSCGSNCNGTCTNGQCMMKCTVDLGSCVHSPCVTGPPLNDFCDPDGCNDLICNFLDSSCCSTNWSQTCVQYAVVFCGLNCSGC